MRDFLFGHTRVSTWDLWISSPALYHCNTATSDFHLWQFQVFNSGAEGLVVVLFWLDLWEIFFLATPVVWTTDLWISSPALYHCVTVTSDFHLWQFQVFNSGAEGLVVVLFWLDLWEIFFLAMHWVWTLDLWISSPALYHCAMETSDFHLWQFQVFNSGAEGLVVVLFWLDLWEIFFLATPGFKPGTSGSLVLHYYHWATVTSDFHLWQFQVFNSGAEGLVVVLFWLDLWEIFFLATPEFEPGTSGSLVLHSTTVSQWLLIFHLWQFQVFNSGAEGLVVVLFWLDLWEIFFLDPSRVWTQDLWISCPALYHCTMVTSDFHLWQFQVFNSGAEGYGGGIVLIGPVRDFLFGHTGVWTQDLWISSPALYHCVTVTSDFHLWQFQVFNSGAEGLVVVLFWLDLWEIFFLATPGFEP